MFPLLDFAFVVVNMVSEKKVLLIILNWIILSFVVKCLDKILSYLFLINYVFLPTEPSAEVFDMIYNLYRSMVFIPLGMLASAADTAESIA